MLEKKILGQNPGPCILPWATHLYSGNSYTLFTLNVYFHLSKVFLGQTLHESPLNYSQSSLGVKKPQLAKSNSSCIF